MPILFFGDCFQHLLPPYIYITKILERLLRGQVGLPNAAAGLLGAQGTKKVSLKIFSPAKSSFFLLKKKSLWAPLGAPQGCGPLKKVKGVKACLRPWPYQSLYHTDAHRVSYTGPSYRRTDKASQSF